MSDGDWCLIESDPGVFTELIRGFGMVAQLPSWLESPFMPSFMSLHTCMHVIGVQGLQVEELWSLEQESFQKLKYVMVC